MCKPPKKRSCRQDHRPGRKPDSQLGYDTGDAPFFKREIVHPLLEQPKVGLVLETTPDRLAIEHPVCLDTRCPYRRPLARIQYAKLDTGFIGCGSHCSAQRINLFHQVPLADASYGRVTRHLPQRFDIVRQQKGFFAHARGREGGLGTGMPPTYDYYIEIFRINHYATAPFKEGHSTVKRGPM
jgi:hypothetical protein